MRKEIFSYLKIAAGIAKQGESDRSFFLGCVGIRGSDNKMVASFNGKTSSPKRSTHAEYRCSRKLTPGSVLYVARITKSGEMALAKPCRNCIKALKSKGCKRVYYSISDSEYGVLDLKDVDLNSYQYPAIINDSN